MAKVPNAVEILPKIWTAWVGRTNVTDDRRTGDSKYRTFAKKSDQLWQFLLCRGKRSCNNIADCFNHQMPRSLALWHVEVCLNIATEEDQQRSRMTLRVYCRIKTRTIFRRRCWKRWTTSESKFQAELKKMPTPSISRSVTKLADMYRPRSSSLPFLAGVGPYLFSQHVVNG